MNRIDAVFAALRRRKRCAFIAYLTAGFPGCAATERLVEALVQGGADIVELGVPFTDPVADGPVIQQASEEALRRGVTLAKIFGIVQRIRLRSQVPLCLMTYYNPVFTYGVERFVQEAQRVGVDGVIIPDLPVEESAQIRSACRRRGIALIAFVAPTSSPARIRRAAGAAKGFIYYVSLAGVTGARAVLPADIAAKVRQIKRYTRTPVCVGFGVSTPAQVGALSRVADGVIVGSAIMKLLLHRSSPGQLTAHVRKLTAALKGRT